MSDPRAARFGVIGYFIAWPDRMARARVDTLVFCDHNFDHDMALLQICASPWAMRAVNTASPLINALARTRSI
jgi:hypothetical protein